MRARDEYGTLTGTECEVEFYWALTVVVQTFHGLTSVGLDLAVRESESVSD